MAVDSLISHNWPIDLSLHYVKLFQEDHKSVKSFFLKIDQFETSKKKLVLFLTDGISVSVLLGEDYPQMAINQEKTRMWWWTGSIINHLWCYSWFGSQFVLFICYKKQWKCGW